MIFYLYEYSKPWRGSAEGSEMRRTRNFFVCVGLLVSPLVAVESSTISATRTAPGIFSEQLPGAPVPQAPRTPEVAIGDIRTRFPHVDNILPRK